MGINYQEKGTGLPILLIHGYCETHEIWGPMVDRFSAAFRVITIDLPGFGTSPALEAPHSIDDVATRVLQFLSDFLKTDSCVVLGHSLGGYVALAMIEKRPELFRAFGLVHSTAFADSDERKAARNKVIEFVKTHGSEPFVRSFIPPLFHNQSASYVQPVVDLALKTAASSIISYAGAMRDRPDRTHVLRSFSGPVLFQAGDKDTIIPLAGVQEQVSMTRNATFSVLQGVAHMGMIERTEEASSAIEGFLRSV